MNPFLNHFSFTGPDRRHAITNPEMLAKIDAAYQQVCTKCSTLGTCSMCRDRHIMEARPLLECSVVVKEMQKTSDPCGHWCDEYTTNHEGYKGVGYCWRWGEPTSEKLLKMCKDDTLSDVGPFCFYCCPFSDIHDGYLCESAFDGHIVDSTIACPTFDELLNVALGGAETWEYEYFFDHGFAYYRGAPLP